MNANADSAEHGWTISEWVQGARLARPTYYTLAVELRPVSTRIGRRVIITESPRAWLLRMAARGGVPSRAGDNTSA
jgi:hypothetical protein